jgi:hypothetical protein
MPKKRKRARHPRGPQRPTVVRRHADPAVADDAAAQPLMQSIRRSMRADHPLDLLATVSAVMSMTESRAGLGEEGPSVSMLDLVESFEEIDLAETTAALHVIATLSPDDLLTARIRRTLATRRQPMPGWLMELEKARVAGITEMRHVQRDGEDYFIDVRLPEGHPVTVMVYVDNNLGGVVKDAFAIGQPYDDVEAVSREHSDADTAWTPVEPGQARALLEQAIEFGSIVFPPLETDTWPACRPLVRWLLRTLPEGGVAPSVHEWSDDETEQLAEAFLSSAFGEGFDDEEHRSLLDDLMWFGTSQGTGDPLRWSPVNVEILLADWYPRKVVGEAALLAKLPQLLRAFIRFSHDREGLRPALTRETLDAVDRWEPDYQQAIRSSRPQGAEALARMLRESGTSWSLEDELADLVGGRAALANLTCDPLPDEGFEWAGIPGDIRPKIEEILRLCDQNAEQLLDIEHRTANRRLLSRLAVADPAFFRGRASARTSAAAVCWMVAHANDSVSMYGPLTAGELLEPFGVRSASQRAKQFRAALGLREHLPVHGPMGLGSPDLLVGDRRAELLEARARLD